MDSSAKNKLSFLACGTYGAVAPCGGIGGKLCFVSEPASRFMSHVTSKVLLCYGC